MPYQRDKVTHFLMYWARHAFGINFELPYRTFMRRSFKDAVYLVGKLLAHWILVYYGYGIFPHATLWLLIMPYIATTGLLMFGNFSQHIFVDPERFDDNFLLTFNCIGENSNNHKIFNDGYHIVHHANSKLAWNEMADDFAENWQEYDK
jgi:fatty acid desaturase